MTATAPAATGAEAVATRVAELLDELGEEGDTRAEELVALVTELHRDGLARALAVLADAPGGRAALESLGDDEVVGGLLVLHDLHPHDLPTRVARALGRMKPDLAAVSAHVAVDSIDEELGVRLTLTGRVGATPLHAMAATVERVVGAAAPEAAHVVVTVVEPPATAGPRPAVRSGPAVSVPVAITQRPERKPPGEHCDLCGVAVDERHRHLVDVEERRLLCACQACGLLFEHDAGPRVLGFPLSGAGEGAVASSVAGGRRYRGLPDRCLALPPPGLSPALWATLQIPVGVAFLFHSTGQGGVVAFYPGPAGATESLLPLDAWDELVGAHPVLATLEPDVEALLVRASRDDEPGEAYVVPMDVCYELVGELRTVWRGFDGGSEARARLDALFARTADRADQPVRAQA